MVSAGRYFVGLFAIRDIRPGEELTFDYFSFTENLKEYEDSVCLCGSQACNGHYLNYSKKHTSGFLSGKTSVDAGRLLLDRPYHSFMRFNALLFVATERVSNEQRAFLRRFGVGDNAFKQSPDWLRSWACLVLQAILAERKDLYGQVLGRSPECAYAELDDDQKAVKSDIEDLYYQRVHNFLVSVDKAQHFLSKQSDAAHAGPPVHMVDEAAQAPFYLSMLQSLLGLTDAVRQSPATAGRLGDFVQRHFGDGGHHAATPPSSTVADPPACAEPGTAEHDCDDSTQSLSAHSAHAPPSAPPPPPSLAEFISDFELLSHELFAPDDQQQVHEVFMEALDRARARGADFVKLVAVKFWLLRASEVVGRREERRWRTVAAVGYFYALTRYHFANRNYKGFDMEVSIRECDLTNPDKIYQRNAKSAEEQLEDLARVIVAKTK